MMPCVPENIKVIYKMLWKAQTEESLTLRLRSLMKLSYTSATDRSWAGDDGTIMGLFYKRYKKSCFSSSNAL